MKPGYTLRFLWVLAIAACAEDPASSPAPVEEDAPIEAEEDVAEVPDVTLDVTTTEGDAAEGPDDTQDGLDAEAAAEDTVAAVPQFGWEGEVSYELVLGAPWIYEPTDLEFDPRDPNRLWVTSRGDDAFVTLELAEGMTGLPSKFVDYYHSYADAVSSLAFSGNNTFASCQESMNTYNGAWEGDGKAGASLWPADLDAFSDVGGTTPGGPLIDNLNGSALCMGIAWRDGHAFYLFDGEHGDLKLFDFKRPSATGAVNPTGGVKYRILKGELIREAGVPSHMHFHEPSRRLFFTDTGNHRILWLDADSGEPGTSIFANPDLGTVYKKWVNPIWGELETEAPLVLPSGLVIRGNRMFVTDHATGIIYALDLDGNVLGELDTGRGFGALAGIELDTQGRLLFVDLSANEVIRVEP